MDVDVAVDVDGYTNTSLAQLCSVQFSLAQLSSVLLYFCFCLCLSFPYIDWHFILIASSRPSSYLIPRPKSSII